MLNRLRTIKSLPLIAVLFTCVVILSSAAIFASEESTPSSEASSDLERLSTLVVPEDYKDPVYQYLASGEGVKAVTYTTTDIYNLLSIALYNEGTTNTWSLPRIAYWTHLTKNNTDSIHQDLREIHYILNGDYSGVYVRPSIQDMLYTSDGVGNFTSIADAIADFPSLTYSAVNQVLSAQQNGNYYLSQINSKLSGDFTWTSYPSTYLGTSLDFDSNYLSSSSTSANFVSSYRFNSVVNPALTRISIPAVRSGVSNDSLVNYSLLAIKTSINGSTFYDLGVPDYFVDTSSDCTYLYIFDFRPVTGWTYYFQLRNSQLYSYSPNNSTGISYIPFDNDFYQQIKQAFYAQKVADAQGSIADDVKHLADYLADPDKIAAEQASQQVIDDTLDGFTGSGSAAAKGSDIGSMKNISGSVQSGLDTGAGVSNATNVFSLNGGFWGWFTQSNSDQINNPYPAPVVNNNRKSSGDEVVDFLSDNQSQVKDLLGESKW